MASLAIPSSGVSSGSILWGALNSEHRPINKTESSQPCIPQLSYCLTGSSANIQCRVGLKPPATIGKTEVVSGSQHKTHGHISHPRIWSTSLLHYTIHPFRPPSPLFDYVANHWLVEPCHEIPKQLCQSILVASQLLPCINLCSFKFLLSWIDCAKSFTPCAHFQIPRWFPVTCRGSVSNVVIYFVWWWLLENPETFSFH